MFYAKGRDLLPWTTRVLRMAVRDGCLISGPITDVAVSGKISLAIAFTSENPRQL